ncbi:acid phosphatase [Asimina triloba]
MIPLLRNMEFTACYFIAGHFETHQSRTCTNSKLYKELAYVISFLPYYWRAMQCARRWFDEGDINHVANLGKYVSAMLAAGARLTYAMQPSPLWLAIVVVTSSVATVYQLYWDFVKDWGLLNPKSKNPWLRDELILKHKGIYYVSIALNFVLRLAWVETVLHLNVGLVEYRLLDFLLASLEIIRRGHWNFYRLENEHLNNVGKFRAVKAVPLPFHNGWPLSGLRFGHEEPNVRFYLLQHPTFLVEVANLDSEGNQSHQKGNFSNAVESFCDIFTSGAVLLSPQRRLNTLSPRLSGPEEIVLY